MKSKVRIAHIVNPVQVPETSDLYIAQPVTFESMRISKNKAEERGIKVQLFYCGYPEDLDLAPIDFTPTTVLQRSVLDFGEFKKRKKLPLIKDILSSLNENSEFEYFIYTNVDIALQPDFYIKVSDLIERGYDGFVINRRTIPSHYNNISQLAEMYKERGAIHPGFDCFVFKKQAFSKFELGSTVIGSVWIGGVLVSNLIMTSRKFKIFRHEHLTFHIGDDRVWANNSVDDIADFNRKQYDLCVNRLKLISGKFYSSLRHYIAYKFPLFFQFLPGRIK